jgi:Sulfatase
VPQVKAWRVLGTFFLLSVLLVAGLHMLLGDYLLFFSDPLSLSVYLGAASFVVLPGLLLLCLPLTLLSKPRREKLRLYAALGLAVLVATVFIMLAVSFIGTWFDITLIKRIARKPFLFFAICAVPALGAIVVRRSPKEIAARTEQLGLALLAVAIVGLPLVQLIQPERGIAKAPGSEKNLVLMILDGMPTQYLNSYRPAAPVGPLDRLAAEGLLFTQTRTSAAWTYAYFGTLYGGSTRVVAAPRDNKPAVDSLIARLQRGGVAARWISNHRNGIPEGSAAHTNDYRGLRSYLLTENTAWIPRLLNLEYHLAIANPGIAQNFRGAFGRAVFDWLNGKYEKKRSLLTGLLLPQLREQEANGGRSFTLFHMYWGGIGPAVQQARAKLPNAQENEDLNGLPDNAIQTIRDNDYRYGPELEPLARQYTRNSKLIMADLGAYLTEFMAALAADTSLKDTVVMVTADHGGMYAKGRFWYGFHPNEEVVRVPLMVFNAGRTGRDDRPVNTLDLNASILGFFGLARNGDSGQSIFDTGPNRDNATTLTLKSDRNKEWILVIVQAGVKYQVNLHPEGRGETVTLRLDGYQETPIAEVIGPPDGMADTIAAAIRDYGIDSKDIHPAFRL